MKALFSRRSGDRKSSSSGGWMPTCTSPSRFMQVPSPTQAAPITPGRRGSGYLFARHDFGVVACLAAITGLLCRVAAPQGQGMERDCSTWGFSKTSSSQANPGFRGAGGAEQGGAQGQAGWAGGGRSLFLHPWVLHLAGTRDPKHWHLLLSPQHVREMCLCRDTCING